MGELLVFVGLDRSYSLTRGRKPIITSHFPSHPPSYPSVCIDAFNHATSKYLNEPSTSSKGRDLDPVIWVNTLNKGGMGGAGICHLQREGLRFLVPVGQEGEPYPKSSLHIYTRTDIALAMNVDVWLMTQSTRFSRSHFSSPSLKHYKTTWAM